MIKKVLAVLMALTMLFLLASCSGKNEPYPEIMASFVHCENDDFVIYVQNLGGVYDELFEEDGLHVKLVKNAKIYDIDGNEINKEDIRTGQTLKIAYSGKLVKKNPKTIKVYEITVIG